ncbi:programmed cell death protein 7-like [Antedon mediterranea]|uniref:programmed cell death protein 7-like n=1 Tax=Antedon mediterranea TaxID=105859 RepID=UPI003AF88321
MNMEEYDQRHTKCRQSSQQNQQAWQHKQQPNVQNQWTRQENHHVSQSNQQLHQHQNQFEQTYQINKPQQYTNQSQPPPFVPSSHNYRPHFSAQPVNASPNQPSYPPASFTPSNQPQKRKTLHAPKTQSPYVLQNPIANYHQPPINSFQNVGKCSNNASFSSFGNGAGPPPSWPHPPLSNTSQVPTNHFENPEAGNHSTNLKPSPIQNENQFESGQQSQPFIPSSMRQSSFQQPELGICSKNYPPQLQTPGQRSHRDWLQNAQNVNYPWPSGMLPSIPPPPNTVVTEKAKDQNWIDNFASKRTHVEQPTNKTSNHGQIKIPQAKGMIKNYKQLLDDLKLQRDLLVENLDIDTESWQLALQQVAEIKSKLKEVSVVLSNPEFICKLTEKLKLRKKKTQNLKRRRQMKFEDQQEYLKNIEEVNKKIDANIVKAEKERLEKVKEKQLQKDIDKTLFEVRKKKKEADKTLEVLRGLRKLRHVRKASSLQKGVLLPVSSETIFEQRIGKMEQFMNRQRAVYTAEEQAMQVMLEEEQEENKEKERQILQQKLRDKEHKQLQLRRKLLFGDGTLHNPQLRPFKEFYKQTEVNIDAFLHVRYTWDQCLVLPHTDGASSIPVAWVKPEPPSSHIWKTALADG